MKHLRRFFLHLTSTELHNFLGRRSSESQSSLSTEWTKDQLTPGPGEGVEEEGCSQGESLDDLRDWTGQTEKNLLKNCCSCSVM